MSFVGSGDGSYTQKQLNYILNRQRSLPVIQTMQSAPSSHQPVVTFYQQQILEYNMGSKSKYATLEIYRPPGLRTNNASRPADMDGFQVAECSDVRRQGNTVALQSCRPKLNVHAKEFSCDQIRTRNSDAHRSVGETDKSLNMDNYRYNVGDVSEISNERTHQLRMSKSSGNLLSTFKYGNGSSQNTKSKINIKQSSPTSKSVQFRLQKARSNECMLPSNQGNKVKFKETGDNKHDKSSVRPRSSNDQYQYNVIANHQTPSASYKYIGGTLKRSKSLNATDGVKSLDIGGVRTNVSMEFMEYDKFPSDLHSLIAQAVKDSNELPDRSLMVLARQVLENVVASRDNALPAAKLSIIIVQRDKKGTYLDTMLNTCQLWFQERQQRLRNNSVSFTSFFAFLNYFYNQFKTSQLQLKLKLDDTSPKLILLSLLYKCCQDTLQHSEKHSLPEVETLFIVLMSIAKDLENELPDSLEQLYVIMRDVFLRSNDDIPVKKTLLQLIESRAAEWQLPLSAIGYYHYSEQLK